MKKVLFIIIGILAIALVWSIKDKDDVIQKWKTAMANVKAYDNQLNDSKKQKIALQLTASQLKNYNDSILKKLNDTRKELKIKDSKLQSLQYVASSFVKEDTIILKDTLFKEPSFAMDTVLGDNWYKISLGFKYPSMIAVKPEFKSEKHIIVSHKKETVNPPKKFFLFRWFQRKHIVVRVDVVEKNPYIDNERSEYIEIIK
jgi:type II secretory pathway pseudopilin PulG